MKSCADCVHYARECKTFPYDEPCERFIWKGANGNANYDRIQAMSVEEMADFLDDMQTDALFLEGTIHDLRYPTEWKQWLESEVQDDG